MSLATGHSRNSRVGTGSSFGESVLAGSSMRNSYVDRREIHWNTSSLGRRPLFPRGGDHGSDERSSSGNFSSTSLLNGTLPVRGRNTQLSELERPTSSRMQSGRRAVPNNTMAPFQRNTPASQPEQDSDPISQRLKSLDNHSAETPSKQAEPEKEKGGSDEDSKVGSRFQHVEVNPTPRKKANTIVIHVFDENKKIQQDFTCGLAELLDGMRYFREYLNDVQNEEVEMSVHCDVNVFEWLLRYVQNPAPPNLELSNCMPILISSDFLKMDKLVDQCIKFISVHLNEVARLPIDLSCLADHLLLKLSKSTPEDTLETVRRFQGKEEDGDGDSKEKAKDTKSSNNHSRQMLVSKLYRLKLEQTLQTAKDGPLISWCAHCGRLYSSAEQEILVCPYARIVVESTGEVVAQHTPCKRWDLTRYLQSLRAQRYTWCEIYWHVWGLLQVMYCKRCGLFFPVCQMAHCSYHTKDPTFAAGANRGVYPCCQTPALRFDSTQVAHQQGCQAQEHQVELDLSSVGVGHNLNIKAESGSPTYGGIRGGIAEGKVGVKTLELVKRHYNMIVVPFKCETSESSAPVNLSSSHNRVFHASLTECLHAALDEPGAEEDSEEDDTDDDSRSSSSGYDSSSSGESGSESGSVPRASHFRGRTVGSGGPGVLPRAGKGRPGRGGRGAKKGHARGAKGKGPPFSEANISGLTPKLQRALRQDVMRDDDDERLEALVASLDLIRKDSPASAAARASAEAEKQAATAREKKADRLAEKNARSAPNSRASTARAARAGSSRFTHW